MLYQVDVYWEYEKSGEVHRVAIECKNYSKRVSVVKGDYVVVIADAFVVEACIVTFTSCGDDDEDSTPAQPSQDTADRDAAGNLKISAINFPDENFRSFLLSQGYGADGVLTEKEIADIKSLEIPSLKIHSLNGIAFFTYLVELDCEHNEITSLDM